MTGRVAGWAEYRTGTWHAHAPPSWRGDGHRSLCGHSILARPEQLRDEPGGRRCRSCLARVRKKDSPSSDGTSPSETYRGKRAGEWADALEEVVAKVACRCVREWPDSGKLVAALEARVGGLLLAWELSGDTTTARDLEDGARAYVRAWREAARRYDLLDGSHPHRRAAR